MYALVVALCLALGVFARPMDRRASFTQQNGEDATALNKKFAGLSSSSPCTAGENACVGSDFAQCVNGKFVTTPCGSGEICAALPLVNKAGTSVTCTTAADRDARIKATGAQGGSSPAAASPSGVNNAAAGGQDSAAKTGSAAKATGSKAAGSGGSGGGEQSSLTLDKAVIAKGFAQDGQATKEAGQVASLTSTNNFINFCATTNQPITNGQQIKSGSCNPAPMGSIPSTDNMPSAKFASPKNLDTIAANKAFTVKLNIKGMETGHFVNAQQNYFAAPQQLNKAGQIQGHSHIVIEAVDSMTQTTPTDPNKFAFFQGLNAAASGGVSLPKSLKAFLRAHTGWDQLTPQRIINPVSYLLPSTVCLTTLYTSLSLAMARVPVVLVVQTRERKPPPKNPPPPRLRALKRLRRILVGRIGVGHKHTRCPCQY